MSDAAPVTPATDSASLRIDIEPAPDGTTAVKLMDGETEVSHCRIVPYTLRIGWATVRMDGIGGVWTAPERRRQGLAERMLRAAIAHMRGGDAALSMLYGIRDYYPRFGYATAGPEHLLYLTESPDRYSLPDGWSVRPFAVSDLPTVMTIYDAMTAASVGAAVRGRDHKVWAKLLNTVSGPAETDKGTEACHVVVAPTGEVAGYVWRSDSFWYVGHLRRWRPHPEPVVFAEAGAVNTAAAVAVLAACRAWTAETASGAESGDAPKPTALLATPPEGYLAAAARLQAAEFVQAYAPCGASMALTLSARRLLTALEPELTRRWREASIRSRNLQIALTIDDERIALSLTPEGVHVEEAPAEASAFALPQTTLSRLALGAFPPGDLLDDLPSPLYERTREILCALFPERYPHMSLPDRF